MKTQTKKKFLRGAVTNITLDYRPTYLPAERLRHGKFFFDDELIQMDTQ